MTFSVAFLSILIYGALLLVSSSVLILAGMFLRDRKNKSIW